MTATTMPRKRATVDPNRLRRAVHLDVQPASEPGAWTVRGGATPHHVTANRGRLECDCADRSIRGAGCKHLLAVLLHRGHPAVVRALREIVSREGKA